MLAVIQLMERYLKDRLPEGYKLKIASSQGGNLPNRAPFIRRTFRQTTLDEFMEGSGYGGSDIPASNVEICYTVHPRWLNAEKVLELLDLLLKDMDLYINGKR
tara:strand:- start:2092 stop:2400 length:309 start_codon:yes stop_codon:yes gene_type:complete